MINIITEQHKGEIQSKTMILPSFHFGMNTEYVSATIRNIHLQINNLAEFKLKPSGGISNGLNIFLNIMVISSNNILTTYWKKIHLYRIIQPFIAS